MLRTLLLAPALFLPVRVRALVRRPRGRYELDRPAGRRGRAVSDTGGEARPAIRPPSPLGEPAFRDFSNQSGLTGHPVYALAQDSTGFLWVGGVGGLFRYDGREFRHWARGVLPSWVASVAVSPGGAVVAVSELGGAFRITAEGADRLLPPPGGWGRPVGSVAFDRRGGLWAVHRHVLSYRPTLAGADGWTDVDPARLGGESPRRVSSDPSEPGVVVITGGGVWRVASAGRVRKLWSGEDVVDVSPDGDDGLLVLEEDGALVALRRGKTRRLLSRRDVPPARAISVVRRRGTAWVAFDRYLVAVHPGGRPDVLGPAEGVVSGGPLLVDREGSLWLGSFQGLLQYPEPRTRRWSDRQGLPSAHVRTLARDGDAIAVTTWQGTGFLRPEGSGWEAAGPTYAVRDRPCELKDGSLLAGAPGRLLRFRDGRRIGRRRVGFILHDCAPAADGGRWLSTTRGLWHLEFRGAGASGNGPASTTGVSLREVDGPPFVHGRLGRILRDRAGRLWVVHDGRPCHASEEAVLAGRGARWSCTGLPAGAVEVTSLVQLPDGALWLATNRRGVYRLSADGWKRISGSDNLPTQSVLNLVASGSGGVWLLGHGFAWRVRDRPDLPAGWKVVERLTGWYGVGTVGAGDLLEEPDGGLWLATDEGVVHVPAEVRSDRPAPPAVVLEEARTDGRSVPLGRPIDLPHDRNRLELHFAALSFRDPGRLRYEVRVSPREPWSSVRGAPSFRWLGLKPGTYRARVRASLDGVHWSASSPSFRFRVDPPWFLEPWVLVLAALLSAALAWAAYRARVAYLLGLERERTRIAMDLHDEVGSGLASVGILSGVLTADGLSGEEAREATREIARTAEELGDALSDIVWSLEPGGGTLEGLAARLAEQGGRLFARAATRFQAELPDAWPDGPLALSVLRPVLLVGLEALHNAARHAGADHVVLRLAPEAEGMWLLEVRDDGNGQAAPSSAAAPGGYGLPGMRRRADGIGADLEIDSEPGRGTAVRLRFRPRGRRTGSGRDLT